MIEQGKLRERVKKGEVSAKEARKALLDMRAKGEHVGDEILAWLERRESGTKVEPPKAKPKKNRKKKEVVTT